VRGAAGNHCPYRDPSGAPRGAYKIAQNVRRQKQAFMTLHCRNRRILHSSAALEIAIFQNPNLDLVIAVQ